MEYSPEVVANPRWSSPYSIDVDVTHPVFGVLGFTAVDNSGEEFMQAVWDAVMNGDHGPIAGDRP